MEVEYAKTAKDFYVRFEAVVMKDVTWTDQVTIFTDIVRSDDTGVVNRSLDTNVLGEVVSCVDGWPFVVSGSVIRDDVAEADADLECTWA